MGGGVSGASGEGALLGEALAVAFLVAPPLADALGVGFVAVAAAAGFFVGAAGFFATGLRTAPDLTGCVVGAGSAAWLAGFSALAAARCAFWAAGFFAAAVLAVSTDLGV